MKTRRAAAGLRAKLVASFVVLSVAITLASLLAGQYVYARAEALRGRHAAIPRGADEIATLMSAAAEEGFSFVLAADPEERALSVDKLASAENRAHELRSSELSAAESAALDQVIAALGVLRRASSAMFTGFERDHSVGRQDYDAYDRAIDGASEAIAWLDRAAVDESARARLSSRRTSDLLTLAIGLLAVAGAILGGSLLGRRITRPLVALRDAVHAFGEGRLDVVVLADESDDEVGDLAKEFSRMALAIEEAREALFQSQKMEAVGQLTGGVAHDFNNVLAAVLACSECALEDVGDAHPVATDLRHIGEAARRGAMLSQQLLSFSRSRAASPRVLSVNDAVESIEPMLSRLAGSGIRLRLTLEPAAPLVLIDATQLDQVLMNLVVNARDASPDGGTVEVCTARATLDEPATLTTGALGAGSYVLLEVRDTGTGMDEVTMARVFEPFYTTKDAGKGTGLGLATIARVVKEAGGAVDLESTCGRGTTFRVYLPVAKRQELPMEMPAAA